MIRMNTDAGQITVDSAVYTNIAGFAATNCFGVKGMAVRSMTDGLVHLLRNESMAKGVRVIFESEDTVSIELHIIVENGVNIAEITFAVLIKVLSAIICSSTT